MTQKGDSSMPKYNLATYLDALSFSLSESEGQINKIVSAIRMLRDEDKRLWILGNGGSLAIGQHFAQDLVKMRGVRAQALTCPSMITAYTNDESFENSFKSPLSVLMGKDDGVMIFSCSGTSRNYKEVVAAGWPLLSVVGCDGGFLKEKSDICVHVKNNNYQICETAFCVIADLVLAELEE